MTLREMLARGILSEEEVFGCYPGQSLDYEPDMQRLIETTGRGAPYFFEAAKTPYIHPKAEYYMDFPDIIASQNSEMEIATKSQQEMEESPARPMSASAIPELMTLKEMMDAGTISQEEVYACFPGKDIYTYVPGLHEVEHTLGRYVGVTGMDEAISGPLEEEKKDELADILVAGSVALLMFL